MLTTLTGCGSDTSPPPTVASSGNEPSWCGTTIAYALSKGRSIDPALLQGDLNSDANRQAVRQIRDSAETALAIEDLPDYVTDALKEARNVAKTLGDAKGTVGTVDSLRLKKFIASVPAVYKQVLTACPQTYEDLTTNSDGNGSQF